MAIEEDEIIDDKTLDEEMTESIGGLLKEIQARPEDTGLEPEVKADRARDETGKFAKESAAPAELPDKLPADGANEQAAADVPLDLNRAPSSWKPAAKAAWAALPEPIRAEIHRREGEFHNATFKGPLKENADFGQSVRSIVEPYRGIIEAEGGTPERAIADTLRTAALFRTGSQEAKLGAIFQLDKQFNIGLQAHFNAAVQAEVAKQTGTAPNPGTPPPAPVYTDSRVDAIQQRLDREDRERQAREQSQSVSAVGAFVSAKDAQGQPLHPFVDNVLDDMNARIPLLRQQNPALSAAEILDKAYEQAVWANPETRAVLIGQQQAQANAPAENLRRVDQAKRASAANVPKRGALPARAPDTALRFGTSESDESIRDTYRQLTATQ